MLNAVKWVIRQIAGNAIWAALVALWCAIMAGLIGVWATVTNLPFPAYLWGGLCVVSSAAFFALAGKLNTSIRPSVAQAIPEESALSVNPHPYKLSIEILEGHVGLEPTDPNAPDYGTPRLVWILFKVRITPTSDPGIAVKEWHIDYAELSESLRESDIKPIDMRLQYASLGRYGARESPLSASPTIQEQANPIPFGHISTGFILVSLYADFPHECFRYGFQIRAVDALNVESIGYARPGKWLRPTKFSFSENRSVGRPALAPYVP